MHTRYVHTRVYLPATLTPTTFLLLFLRAANTNMKPNASTIFSLNYITKYCKYFSSHRSIHQGAFKKAFAPSGHFESISRSLHGLGLVEFLTRHLEADRCFV